VLGVSKQDEKSHREFRDKHKLPFDLLVDGDGKLAESLGVDTMPLIGFHKRQSVLIAPDGKIAKIYKDVTPEKHPAEVLADVEKLAKP
jgi:thioredoxin-dependent peroxiredoxin